MTVKTVVGTLEETLRAIGETFGFSPKALMLYAEQDMLTGFDFGAGEWPTGSLHRPEGQTLYALIRQCKPALIAEFGTLYGCSAAHLGQAVADNSFGHVLTVDHTPKPDRPLPAAVTSFWMMGEDFMRVIGANQLGFVFEDTDHSYESTHGVWEPALEKVKPGGWIISHDPAADEKVIRGAVDVVGEENCLIVLVPPSDCGLLIYRKPL